MIVAILDTRGDEIALVDANSVTAIVKLNGTFNVAIHLASGKELRFENVRYTDVRKAVFGES